MSLEINTIVDVSRSFYDAMLTIEQVELWEEEITRLERNYQDGLPSLPKRVNR